ncbi:unnamed protein product [Didymodactylos carnosus]|uniref:Ephrin RBD domain-containing protein n=1 Tax=Didymodactylos carnosus TaxID=1234261 RepID=A0A813WPN0_9BILA|nr:unnamed protein product [Didymodactylos carnosus]CAF1161132.1 unnamed protein product [Didymodactylos carnosus]CAF3644500.1 unnamed protein product [Didymodactylos carnosus]CAF3972873.1 unnamed protein product [Didymodactylos carnosus]
MKLLILVTFFSTISTLTTTSIRRRYYRPRSFRIYWNSSNEIFSSVSPAILYVHLGDKIDFICPKVTNELDPVEYSALYIVSKEAYEQCYSNNYLPLMYCNRPLETQIYTITIAQFLPYPDALEFYEQKEYYFISTSNGYVDGIDQIYNGLCKTKNMRLILDIQKRYNHYSSISNNETRNIIMTKQISKRKNIIYNVQKQIASNSMSILLSLKLFSTCYILYLLKKF